MCRKSIPPVETRREVSWPPVQNEKNHEQFGEEEKNVEIGPAGPARHNLAQAGGNDHFFEQVKVAPASP